MQRWFLKSHLTIPCQDLSHPWIGLLLVEGETRVNYSRCAATLVGDNFYSILFHRLEALHYHTGR